MQDTDIRIGNVYDIKVGKNTTAIRIMRLAEGEGWEAVGVASNKPLIIRSASRIVGLHNPKTAAETPTLAPVETDSQEPVKEATCGTEPTQAKRGGLSAAAQVLAEAGTPLNCTDLVRKMFNKGLWISNGNTPVATIYSAIIREIKNKGDASRFRKTEHGMFELVK